MEDSHHAARAQRSALRPRRGGLFPPSTLSAREEPVCERVVAGDLARDIADPLRGA